MATRREWIEAIADRYHAAARAEKKVILDEFINVTGFHRKHAIRALKRTKREASSTTGPRSRLYEEAVTSALAILWEAADRICRKRLKAAIPTLLNSMEQHGHLGAAPPACRVRGHNGSTAEAGQGGRKANAAKIGDQQHATTKKHRRADVQRWE